MNNNRKVENVIKEVSSFCNKNNVDFKYCEDLKTDSYIFRFSKGKEEIQMKFTIMELVEAPFTSIVIQKIQDKISGLD